MTASVDLLFSRPAPLTSALVFSDDRSVAAVTGVQALGQVGLLTMAGAAVIPVLGVVGLGQIGEALVWGVIDDRQTANWQNIPTGLAPAWDSISTDMAPSWSPVQTNPNADWSAVGTTQDPNWAPVEM